MQYKIPVQIENEDPIFLWLGLKQLSIIMIWGAISYMIFKWLAPGLWAEVAAIPTVFLFLLTIAVAVFKHSEMTFIPFILNVMRQKINSWNKIWVKWVDSIQSIDIWYVTVDAEKKRENISNATKIEKIKGLDEKLKNI